MRKPSTLNGCIIVIKSHTKYISNSCFHCYISSISARLNLTSCAYGSQIILRDLDICCNYCISTYFQYQPKKNAYRPHYVFRMFPLHEMIHATTNSKQHFYYFKRKRYIHLIDYRYRTLFSQFLFVITFLVLVVKFLSIYNKYSWHFLDFSLLFLLRIQNKAPRMLLFSLNIPTYICIYPQNYNITSS